mmetsp:Transcript_12788/g.35418  ORF Transcript_12788/g.35418 Transcript_12788/m.35418 type:complete len:217 (-) Transcript_12788:153-803(-)
MLTTTTRVQASDTFPSILTLTGCTFALASVMQWMLHQYEWFQAYRYTWPLIGLLFTVDSANTIVSLLQQQLYNDEDEEGGMSQFSNPPSSIPMIVGTILIRLVSGLAGVGLVIGGAYDAFMPVWMTGPNVFTAAGVGQDSAMILWILTALSLILRQHNKKEVGSEQSMDVIPPPFRVSSLATVQTSFWAFVILLSQLYILSDAAFEDVSEMINATL